jgi:hypothetical protein
MGDKIWLPVDEALAKFKQYRHLITAVNYITPFNPVSERDVKHYFNTDQHIKIYSQTPSVGEIWPTHPSYRYMNDSKSLFGRNVIFSKVSTENNVSVELENLHKMSLKISVPTPITKIETTQDIKELKAMKPNCQVASMLVEEFIDSISLGRALIEENIGIDLLVDGVVKILGKMHEFCTHRDLKQSHIRIRLDPEMCRNLTFGIRPENELVIEDVSVIDVETAKMNDDLPEAELGPSVANDINQLLVSLTGYLSTLENQSEELKKILPMPIEQRMERYGLLLNAIFERYTIPKPKLVIKHSKTMEFLMKTMDEHGMANNK